MSIFTDSLDDWCIWSGIFAQHRHITARRWIRWNSFVRLMGKRAGKKNENLKIKFTKSVMMVNMSESLCLRQVTSMVCGVYIMAISNSLWNERNWSQSLLAIYYPTVNSVRHCPNLKLCHLNYSAISRLRQHSLHSDFCHCTRNIFAPFPVG